MVDVCPQCTFNDDYTKLMSAPNGAKEVTIPNSILSIYGGDINKNAFYVAKTTLKYCFFEENSKLQTIEKYSFCGCSSLLEINLSKCTYLTSIGDYAFNGCSSLKTISLPSERLTSLGGSAFSYSGITSIFLPASVTKFGESLFAYASNLQNVQFDANIQVTEIPNFLFRNCNSIKEITIPKNVVTILDAFDYCYSLVEFRVSEGNSKFVQIDDAIYSQDGKTIFKYPCGKTGTYRIQDGVEKIDQHCFITSQLSEIIMPNTVKETGIYSFFKSTISNITLSTNLTSLGGYSFELCIYLKSIVLPDGLQTIGDKCFSGCQILETINIPSSVTKIGGDAFGSCSENLTINIENGDYFMNQNDIFIDIVNNMIIMYTGNSTNITISQSVKTIGSSSFSKKKNLENVIFENNSNLTSIDMYAFRYCSNLKSIQFPQGLAIISNYAFESCASLMSVSIPSSTSQIGYHAFANCYSIQKVEINSESPDFYIDYYAFFKCSSITQMTLPNVIQIIRYYCFSETGPIEEVCIPASVQVIENHAFYKSKIKKLVFSNSSELEMISEFAFSQCENLESIEFPNTLKNISQHCFSNTKLESIKLPESIEYLGDYCFSDIKSLINFTIPKNSKLQNISFGVFSGCSSFTNIFNSCDQFKVENTALYNYDQTQFIILPPNSPVIYFNFPTTLRTIKPCALMGCHKLEIVFIPPDSVTEIHRNAFENCVNLRQINIPSSVKDVYSDLFLGCNKLQCGIRIENREPEFINKLVTVSKLPRRCISECLCTLKECKYDYIRSLIAISIVFSCEF